MNKEKCAKCNKKVYEDMIFIPKIGWVCEDCSIDELYNKRLKDLKDSLEDDEK